MGTWNLSTGCRPFTRSHSTRERIAGQIMITFILLFFFCSCQGRPQIGNTDPQQQQSIVSLQSGQEQFTNRLLQQIESNTTTNFVLSPHSIHSVFSQLLQGSGGQTKAELENLLGVTASDSLVEQYRILGQGLSGEGFKQANLLAVANSFKPKREYRTSLNNGFQSDIREFDFAAPQKQTQVESGVVKVSRAELNPFKQRGGAKLSRTSLKLPSSFNAETEPKPLCVMYYLSLLKI